ncbi:hypothetical protein HII36_38755 [Nonomuraea sp. NN258]|uniref:hypothetical protein n=1 Tax=Nonomuraea antri TaxID=2730852 RepID=UPI001569D158|nr:hypothetical protein [Nonomuraea antri]NRQ37729.1 hypothetical protein [Nonomuraea antri]
MKRRVRLLVATATGAAVLFGGAGIAATSALAAQHAVLAADDFTGDATAANAFIPLETDVEATVTLKLKNPATVSSVTGGITPSGKSEKPVAFDFKPPQVPAPSGSASPTPSPAADVTITGKWTIGKDDPAGDWKLVVNVTRDGASKANEFVVKVAGKQGISSAYVTPNPVQLVKGQDTKVTVTASVKDAGTVSAKLVSDSTNEYYDLGDLAKESDGYYRGVTYFSDDTTPGTWSIEIYASRGGQQLKAVGSSFTVEAPAGGATKKAKSRVTLTAPNKVKLGKTLKIYGKVYRGTKAYSGKIIEVYFKTKGTKKYKFLGFVKATSTGKFSKTYKAKKDGYFQVKVPGTSKTRSSLSRQEFVDVR